jgi:hypothetical protein
VLYYYSSFAFSHEALQEWTEDMKRYSRLRYG